MTNAVDRSPGKIRRAALIAKHTLAPALAALAEAADFLAAHGCQPTIEENSAVRAGLGRRWPVVTREEIGRETDVVIAFGGDGTLLDAASAVAHSNYDAPLLGINLGRLGFLTDVGRADMLEALGRLVAGRASTETRLLLEGRIMRAGAGIAQHLALNDIVVTRGALARMIEIDVSVDDEFVSHVKADGLIVATATGSTAYNLSAGGPILLPSADALVVTPLAPHALANRPVVLPATARIELRPSVEPDTDPVVTFDGQYGVQLAPDDVVTIARAPRALRLMRTSSRTHFGMLREKLKWGEG
jgi:NAD+ kinase